MKYIADLHIHSYLSRACSQRLRPEHIHYWARLKGLNVVATGDFTHPLWIKELKEKLDPAEDGLFRLKDKLILESPASCQGSVRFVLGVEISSIYKKNGKVRRVHNLVFMPSFAAAEKLNARLERIGNIRSDGRPILGLDSRDLLEIVLECGPGAALIPAHAWTPHFAVFGSMSGFDTLEECFEDLAPHIFAIETGLSSDPTMNWRLPGLDKIALISNSDAHSPEKLAREANVLDAELSYAGMFNAFKKRAPGGFMKTLEFFPEEGKYHVDGHRDCKTRLEPAETLRRQGLCPACGKPVTVGVLHRIEKLAGRPEGARPKGAADFEHIIPLKEVAAETLQVRPASVKVDALYHKLLSVFGPELHILREAPLEKIEAAGYPLLALALGRMRRGEVQVFPGYDGEYGVIRALREADFKKEPVLA